MTETKTTPPSHYVTGFRLPENEVKCSCGAWVPEWRYGAHRWLSGVRAWLRQGAETLKRRWL